jgi:polyferredoxin
VLAYAALLLVLVAGWTWGVTARSTLIAEVLRDRNALYRSAGDGRIENNYTLKLVNKDDRAQVYRVTIESDLAGVVLHASDRNVEVAAQQVVSLPLTVAGPAGARGRHALRFRIATADGSASEIVDSSFFGPSP